MASLRLLFTLAALLLVFNGIQCPVPRGHSRGKNKKASEEPNAANDNGKHDGEPGKGKRWWQKSKNFISQKEVWIPVSVVVLGATFAVSYPYVPWWWKDKDSLKPNDISNVSSNVMGESQLPEKQTEEMITKGLKNLWWQIIASGIGIWAIIMTIGVITFLIIRYIKKKRQLEAMKPSWNKNKKADGQVEKIAQTQTPSSSDDSTSTTMSSNAQDTSFKPKDTSSESNPNRGGKMIVYADVHVDGEPKPKATNDGGWASSCETRRTASESSIRSQKGKKGTSTGDMRSNRWATR